jgi:DNA-binding PadR family transcriptional regulator
MPKGVVEPGKVLPAPGNSLVLAPMNGLIKRDARPGFFRGSPRNRHPSHDPARAKNIGGTQILPTAPTPWQQYGWNYDPKLKNAYSLGSTVPALKRLESAGLIKKKEAVGAGKRPRHNYQLSAAGRTRAQKDWKIYLNTLNPMDLDAVLRVADMARYYNAKTADIADFLRGAVAERIARGISRRSDSDGRRSSLTHMTTLIAWNRARLKAEAKFLAALAKPAKSTTASRSKS